MASENEFVRVSADGEKAIKKIAEFITDDKSAEIVKSLIQFLASENRG